jgi:hypothetical protein
MPPLMRVPFRLTEADPRTFDWATALLPYTTPATNPRSTVGCSRLPRRTAQRSAFRRTPQGLLPWRLGPVRRSAYQPAVEKSV